MLKNVKLILSGSSILQLSDRVSESLRGRTISFVIEPFSLAEVVPEVPAISLEDFLNEEMQKKYAAATPYQNGFLLALNKQFVFGSLPRIFLSENNEQRQWRLAEYIQALIQRDVIETLRVAKYLDFEKMLRLLSFQAGQILNVATLANERKILFIPCLTNWLRIRACLCPAISFAAIRGRKLTSSSNSMTGSCPSR